MIWQHTQEAATKEWKPQTQFFEGDVVSHDGNHYRCVFDGRLELPSQINIENITTNIKGSGDVFAFWEGGTDIPTKVGPTGQWKIKVDNADCCRFRTFANGYFGHAGNPAPTITITTSGASGTSGYTKGETDALLRDKANVNHGHHLPAPEAADNTRFLRNDGTYQKVTPDAIGAYTKGETDTLIGDKAPLASPALTGSPTAPTAAKGTNDTQIANTAFVTQAVATLVNSAPETLDTLQELAKALNNDPNFATTLLNLLAGKVSKSGDTMTGGLTASTFYANDWFRCNDNCGIHWQKWGGGWHMTDDTWIRCYGDKGIYTGGKMKANAGFEGPLRGTASNAEKLGNMTLAELLAEVDRRIAAKHP